MATARRLLVAHELLDSRLAAGGHEWPLLVGKDRLLLVTWRLLKVAGQIVIRRSELELVARQSWPLMGGCRSVAECCWPAPDGWLLVLGGCWAVRRLLRTVGCSVTISMKSMNPLSSMLNDNKFIGLNFSDCLRNLNIVQNMEALGYILETQNAMTNKSKDKEVVLVANASSSKTGKKKKKSHKGFVPQ
ncbi:hypothetical protein CRG98_044876 [Punica granatum]|uniref:Uncharacterized protein n=1 Tax=Punica granatum TaxID=22663 RepID=A0A2I0HSQ7_PUNGR|nr:hypothetical protein CRG98_044876 [Punica granatum]